MKTGRSIKNILFKQKDYDIGFPNDVIIFDAIMNKFDETNMNNRTFMHRYKWGSGLLILFAIEWRYVQYRRISK